MKERALSEVDFDAARRLYILKETDIAFVAHLEPTLELPISLVSQLSMEIC